MKTCAYCGLLALIAFAPASIQGQFEPDGFGAFYLKAKEAYKKGSDTLPIEEKLAILNEIERQAESFPGSPWTGGALIWVGKNYRTLAQPLRAVSIFERLVGSQDLPRRTRDLVKYELGLALSGAARTTQATAVWEQIVADETADVSLRKRAANRVRLAYLAQEDWQKALQLSELLLGKNLTNKPPVLLDTIGRCLRKLGRAPEAEQYYRRILDHYPNFRPKNRMIYVDKAVLMCKYDNQVERIGFLEEWTRVVKRYEQYAARNSKMFKEVYLGYAGIGFTYKTAQAVYQSWGEEMPIAPKEAVSRSISFYRKAIEGLERLPLEQKDPEVLTCIYSSYSFLSDTLAHLGQKDQAVELLEKLLNDYGEVMSPLQTETVQKKISTLLFNASWFSDEDYLHLLRPGPDVFMEESHQEDIQQANSNDAPTLPSQIFIPTVDAAIEDDRPFVFNLSSKELIECAVRPGGEQAHNKLVELGKGDLAWDGALLTVRKAKALTPAQESHRPLKCTPGRWCNRDTLPEKVNLPYSLLVVTNEDVDYLVRILKIEADGIMITYSKLPSEQVEGYLPTPATSAEL